METPPLLFGPDGRPADLSARAERFTDLTPSAMYGNFQGAQWSRDRGYIYFPNLDSETEVDQWSRLELMRRSRFVYNSGGGLVHRLINGLSRMEVGRGIWPHPLSADKKWCEKRKKLFQVRSRAKGSFDLSRKYSWVSALKAIQRTKKKDGDMFPVLARDEDGILRCAFYEGNQVGCSPIAGERPGKWRDGVQLGPHNQPLAYEILTWDQGGVVDSVIVPAINVLHQADFERPGQVRGLTKFYPVINRILDRNEIKAALTKGIKVHSNIAYVVEQQMSQTGPTVPGAPGSGLPDRPTREILTPDGRRVTIDQFFNGAEAWGLKPGQTFKIVQTQNPHPNTVNHLDNAMVREICWACGYAPEVGWNVIELGGANSRFIMADTQQQIEDEQDLLIEQFCAPWYLAETRDLIERGELWDVDDWMLHGWTFPRRLTVDFGRDGRLYIDQYKRAMVTLKSLYGFTGDEWQQEIDQYLDERQYIVQGTISRDIKERDGTVRSMTALEAFPELQNVGVNIAATAAGDVADDEEDGTQADDTGDQEEGDEEDAPQPKKKKAA